MSDLKYLIKMIKDADTVFLVTHINPDGDALGSTFALCYALKSIGKTVICACDGNITQRYQTIYKEEQGFLLEKVGEGFDLAIALDCADKGRIGSFASAFYSAKKTANIDHHMTNDNFADINIVKNASSTGEIIYELLTEADISITEKIAQNLYIAMVSDTGNFSYSNTTKKCFLYTAELIGKFDHEGTARLLFHTRTYGNTKIIELAIRNLELFYDGKVAIIHLSKKEIASCGANTDYDAIVSYGIEIDTVIACAFLREQEPGLYKVSLRSKGDVDVAKLSLKFSGGGHKNAAGFSLAGSLSDVKQQVAYELSLIVNKDS
ncbi:MAG: bifunctional oligoribonuclease/PAP phosphatase NrnA [Eubacteriales bacterium]